MIKQNTKFATKNRTTVLPVNTAQLINDVVAILFFASSIILFVVLISYSPIDSGWYKLVDEPHIQNQFGIFGAYLADIIYSVLGMSGYWLVIGLFYVAYRKIIRNKEQISNWYNAFQFITFIFLVIFSSIFEFRALSIEKSNYLHAGYGGIFGKWLYPIVEQNIGFVATEFLIIIALIATFAFTFSFVLNIISEKLGQALLWLYYYIINFNKQKDNDEEYVTKIVAQTEITQAKIIEDDFTKLLDELNEQTSQQTLPIVDMLTLKENKEINIVASQEISKNKLPKIKQINIVNDNNALPSTDLLALPQSQIEKVSSQVIEHVSVSIENKLSEFGVEAKIINAESGPVITRYELLPSRGIRGDKIVGLGKEIARGLALTSVRIVETIPGKTSMGIEVPNFKRQIIYLKEIFDSVVYQNSYSKLTLALGKDIAGNVIVTDLAKMPHLLVAGTTGSGKSVAVNAMILSILFQATPNEVKFIMIDPKMVELSFYHDIPHLLAPVVTDMTQAANALKWTVGEMERRYRVMAKIGCKNIASYNDKIANSLEPIINPLTANTDNPTELEKWPFIVVIIDELADLMMVTGKKTEQYIARIAQKARAVGIHLIVATQRPSVDVITGLIKANIPARISFQVSSKIDSRTILDQMGAETLLGQGDMLFLQPGSGYSQRIHGAYVNDNELNEVVEYLKATSTPEYIDEILTGSVDSVDLPSGLEDDGSDNPEKDSLFDEAVKFIYDSKRCSISSLQTRFGIGYNRAARIMAHLEQINMVKRNDKGGFEILKVE